MGVNIPKGSTPAATPPADSTPETPAKAPEAVVEAPQPEPEVRLALSAHVRYSYAGFTYQKGSVYRLEPDFAATLLRLRTDGGKPVFIRYEEPEAKPTPAPGDGDVRVERPKATSPSASAPAAQTGGKLDPIVIGSDQELIDAGILDPEDAGKDDDGEGVTV